MAVEVKLKRWGNSMAVIVPNSIIEQKKLRENEAIFIEVVKRADLRPISGLIKERKMSGQQAKSLARRGWESGYDSQRWKK